MFGVVLALLPEEVVLVVRPMGVCTTARAQQRNLPAACAATRLLP